MKTETANLLIVRAGSGFRSGSGVSLEEEAAIFSFLHAFLSDEALLRPGFQPPASWSNYELRTHDLTDEGLAVVRCGLDKWLRAIDRGTTPAKCTALAKCLDAIRSNAARQHGA